MGNKSSNAGDQAEVQAQQAAQQARLGRMQTGAYDADINTAIGMISTQLQEFDQSMNKQLGATALQLARSGNLARSRRSIAVDETMGLEPFEFQTGITDSLNDYNAQMETLGKDYERMQGEAEKEQNYLDARQQWQDCRDQHQVASRSDRDRSSTQTDEGDDIRDTIGDAASSAWDAVKSAPGKVADAVNESIEKGKDGGGDDDE